jgi:glyoxylase-like metal-dependent hydrolase (beta-lactamase superfamily II)
VSTVSGEWTGGSVAPWAECVLAANPGPMTLDGTNSWLLSTTGAGQAVVVDPGPADPSHLDALIAAARGAEIQLILLTHGHLDHSEAVQELARRSGAPVRAAGPAWCRGAPPLRDGEVLDAGGLRLEVLLTPGHTADSACFVAGEVLLSGDTVLGRGTSVVAHPDGTLADYLQSLRRLELLATERRLSWIWPGHGPVLADPAGVLRGYLEHRLARLAQVEQALDAGARDAADVVRLVYADLAASLWPAAERSVLAQLEYLRTR